ncbi:hypothetical protein AAFC00_006343 [Neodothiora populina]|uniref:Cytochrome P450 monooxygenase n=1 Tax=Neodothiora populina TaxID=2781224 RepID=A0ABR3P585_9PEZI
MAPTLWILGVSLGAAVVSERVIPASNGQSHYARTAVVLAIVQVLAWIAWRVVIWPKLFSPLRRLPTPPGAHYFLGHGRIILQKASGEPMREWIDTVPNDGLIYYLNWLNMERVLLTNPNTLAEVLTLKNYEFIKPAHFRTVLGRILGVGVLLAEGDEHKRQRKNLMPAFAFRHIRDLCPLFWTKSVEMIEGISEAITQPAIDAEKSSNIIEAGDWSSRATLDIIGLAGMGQDFGAIKDPSNKLSRTYKAVFTPPRSARILGIIGLFVPIWLLQRLPIKRNQELSEASEVIKQTCRDSITTKKAKMESGEKSELDILSVALESGGFTDEDLVSQMMTFLAAGHETTSSAFTWTLYYLCKYPEVQKKMREEIRQVLPSPRASRDQVTAKDLDNCRYINAVCNEVLRVMPPVSLTMRVAANDATINGQLIPKDTTVVVAPYAVNTSAPLWGHDSKEFKPERWLAPGQAGKGGAESNYSFLTFLHGPRSCIGQAFSKLELVALLGAFVGRFEAEFRDEGFEAEIQGGITSRPKGGLWLKVKDTGDW